MGIHSFILRTRSDCEVATAVGPNGAARAHASRTAAAALTTKRMFHIARVMVINYSDISSFVMVSLNRYKCIVMINLWDKS